MEKHLKLNNCNTFPIWTYPQGGGGVKCCYHSQCLTLCVLAHMYNALDAMIITLMPHFRIGPYKEGVTIFQIQMPYCPIVRSWTLLLLWAPDCIHFQSYILGIGKVQLSGFVGTHNHIC